MPDLYAKTHYFSQSHGNRTIMLVETISRKTGLVVCRSEWYTGRFACGDKEEMRKILSMYREKFPGTEFKLRGYGGSNGKPIVFEIIERCKA